MAVNYVTYEYYANEYCGCGATIVSAENFHKYLLQAQSVIDLHTFGRCKKLKDIPDEIKNCCCEIVELIGSYEDIINTYGGVSSEKNNNYSVTYESSETLKNRLEDGKIQAVYRWLEHTGLLYRGC